MDLKDLQKLLSGGGNKVVIVENGKPIMVLLSFEEYQNKPRAIVQNKLQEDSPPLSSFEKEEEESSLPEVGELTIDDLPL